MLKKMFSTFFLSPIHRQWMKALLLLCNTAAFVIYLFMHLAFFGIPFEPGYEAMMLLKLFGVASCFALVISGAMILADLFDHLLKKQQPVLLPQYIKPVSLAVIALVLLLSACNGQTVLLKGVKKDASTGISSTYINMEPGKIMLLMNNEMLHHTDIPLGEKFLLVNENIKGLTIKNGKAAVGCALTISDKKGSILLQNKDLFAGHDLFPEKDAARLTCTISTGAPMQWEEKYNVQVIFWDKYGKGKIENRFSIRCIDIP